MSVVQAYYHDNIPGAQSLPHDSRQAVPIETLSKLGYTILSVNGPDYEEKIGPILQKLGYERTDESVLKVNLGEVPENLDLDPQHSLTQLFTRLGQQSLSDSDRQVYSGSCSTDLEALAITASRDLAGIVQTGGLYLDIQEPQTTSWIRVVLVPGAFFHVPAGSIRRVFMDNVNKANVSGILLCKGPWSIDLITWGKDAENHPKRSEYLRSIGL
ncbi:hypothetical protein BT96DRAFT_925322 [Gymnopus androsaceus JB14]|uniref:Uncharacterized protein n=1 Tax=Gymnopus androsaceus JB14 TaxID=1447944 RepID=A0A6A4H2G0_9AGAR|nr:hypothetical protein BT96DRAFT_925322 [Gymnopus androsaceus JB14]